VGVIFEISIMAKDYAIKLYNSRFWATTRDAYFKSVFGICERCGSAGDIVHHKQHISPRNINDTSITLSWDNLEVLCIDCHNKEHFGKGGTTIDGLCFAEDGTLKKIAPLETLQLKGSETGGALPRAPLLPFQ
jgi:hypothetical protein